MEAMGVIFEEEWESLSGIFSTEEANFMAHLHGQDKRDNDSSFSLGISTFWPSDEANVNASGNVDESLFYSSDSLTANFHYFSQESITVFVVIASFFQFQAKKAITLLILIILKKQIILSSPWILAWWTAKITFQSQF